MISELIPLGVLVASFLGSAHCAAMCGPLVGTLIEKPADHIFYHLMRGLGYGILGFLAGSLGEWIFESDLNPWVGYLKLFSQVMIAGLFFFMAARLYQGKSPDLLLFKFKPNSKFFSRSRGVGLKGASLGLVTVFLPCGWLHAFVLSALASGSTSTGIGVMLLFWLGTIPALAFSKLLMNKLFRPVQSRFPRAAAILLVCVGTAALFQKNQQVWVGGETCHLKSR